MRLSLRIRDKNECGFTLIELLVVILIIGILAAIAIPMFLNQRKEAISASVASDVKNAATAMEQELVRNKGAYPPAIPVYDKQGKDNMVYLDSTRSSKDSFCLVGKNNSYADITYSYSSSDGGMLPKGKTCAEATLMGTSTVSALASKKALIVNTTHSPFASESNARNALSGAGITQIDTALSGTLTLAQTQTYDIIVLAGGVWTISDADRAVAITAYNTTGVRILTDGNDSTGWSIPLIDTAVARKSPGVGIMVGVNPTYTEGLTPSFPYLFSATGFLSSDNWYCTKTVKPGVVVMGDSPDPEVPDETCSTMIGGSSPSGGCWVHETYFSANGLSSPNTDPTVAAIKWLLQ